MVQFMPSAQLFLLEGTLDLLLYYLVPCTCSFFNKELLGLIFLLIKREEDDVAQAIRIGSNPLLN